jgi:hypothetical protein
MRSPMRRRGNNPFAPLQCALRTAHTMFGGSWDRAIGANAVGPQRGAEREKHYGEGDVGPPRQGRVQGTLIIGTIRLSRLARHT